MSNVDAFKYLGGCLISVLDPVGFAKKYFYEYLKEGEADFFKQVNTKQNAFDDINNIVLD